MRRRVFKRDGFRCQICGKAGRLECDHKKPITQGGAFWDPRNLQTICRKCHLEKTAGERPKDPKREAWRVFRDELV